MSSEDLRLAFARYCSFFSRVLSAQTELSRCGTDQGGKDWSEKSAVRNSLWPLNRRQAVNHWNSRRRSEVKGVIGNCGIRLLGREDEAGECAVGLFNLN